ncbi:DNA repair protein XRCC4-like isoform X1 [Zingiber officinale]|uniref:DNA repair protein XRCC4-like isoform X1 n=1 Tax=Zingiber officinale TaxID=94328 RepID=UPI001C4B1D5E|nr:DNA repair protein XRCC4-like isoform X1 [Zingiber officinale]
MAEDHSDIASASTRNTCLRLELPVEDPKSKDAVFVKAAWFPSCFELAISDGLNAWACHATEAEVRLRAEQWDLSVTEYISLSEQYLGFQQPGSKYGFEDAGNGQRRLSWTFEKQGTKLEWRWKCKPSSDNKKMTSGILDFLMDANIRLSEEVVRRARSFEILKSEADKCLEQSERFSNEKSEFESAVYNKFVAVLNSKKAKLRELRDKLSSLEATAKAPKEEDDSTDKTESLDEASDRETLIKEEPDEE